MDIKNARFPEGTVVKLLHDEMKMMIVGIGQQDEKTGEIYDYCAVPYPQGYVNGDKMLLFNDDKIKEVFHMGYLDDDVFNHKLNVFLTVENIRNN